MPYEFKLPDLGEGLTEGEIARWLVSEGDEVAEDQPLVEIQTDKTTVEIPSPAAGTVTSIHVAEGDIVPVGTVLVVIGGGAGAAPAPPPPSDMSGVRPRDLSNRAASSAHRRRRSSVASRRSSASPSTPSPPRGRAGGSPRRTSGPRPARPRAAARKCAVFGGRSSST